MPESEHPSLPVPRNSRVSSSEGLFRSPIPLLDMRSSLFPLVYQCQPRRATARNGAPSLALQTLYQPQADLRFTDCTSRALLEWGMGGHWGQKRT